VGYCGICFLFDKVNTVFVNHFLKGKLQILKSTLWREKQENYSDFTDEK
jgi:hypothetical protein